MDGIYTAEINQIVIYATLFNLGLITDKEFKPYKDRLTEIYNLTKEENDNGKKNDTAE